MTIKISLGIHEMTIASMVGCSRRNESTFKGHKDRNGYDDKNGWNIDIEGAAGEMSVAKYLDIYWNGSVNTFKAPDLGNNIQIRTRSEDSTELIVRPKDKDDEIFIYVRGKAPHFEIVGWIFGEEAKKEVWLKDPPNRGGLARNSPAYFIPESALRDPETLRDHYIKSGINA